MCKLLLSYVISGHYLEGEGNDRADISLPGHQLDMLKDSAAASTNG